MDINQVRAMLAQLGQQQQGGQGAPPPPPISMPPGMGMPSMGGAPPGMSPGIGGMGMDPDMDGAGMLPDSKLLGGFSPANGMDPDVDGDMDNSMPTDQSFEEIMRLLSANAAPPPPPRQF